MVNGTELDLHTLPQIPPGGSDKYMLPNDSLALNASEYTKKALRVSCENCNFKLQVFIDDKGYVEGFMGVALETMKGPNEPNKFYEFIAATFCATGGYCQVAVAANADNTLVFLKVKVTTHRFFKCLHIYELRNLN